MSLSPLLHVTAVNGPIPMREQQIREHKETRESSSKFHYSPLKPLKNFLVDIVTFVRERKSYKTHRINSKPDFPVVIICSVYRLHYISPSYLRGLLLLLSLQLSPSYE